MKTGFMSSLLALLVLGVANSSFVLTPEESVKEITDHLEELKPITWVAPAEKYHLVVFIDNQCSYCSE